MKWLEGIRLFAHADKLHWLARNMANRERRTTSRIAIHLGQNDACKRQPLVELISGLNRILAGHGVGNEEDFLRGKQLLKRLHFAHQVFIDVQTAGSVDDER